MQNGVMVLPFESELEGLDSRYTFRWLGPWLGARARKTRGALRVRGRLALYLGQHYSAQGQWNLREDLEQPVSFDQSGFGMGLEARVRGEYALGAGVTIAVQGHSLWLSLRDGEDRLYGLGQPPALPGEPHSPPTTFVAELTEVVWSAAGAQIGLSLDL